MSIETIAEVRHLKVDTVESYLAEAITAGRAYDWHRMRVSDSVYATVSQHASAQLRAAEEPKEAGGLTGMSADVSQEQDGGLQQESVLQQSMASREEGAAAEGVHQQEAALLQSQALSSDGECEVCCAQPSQPSNAEKENCLQADVLQLERLCRNPGTRECCNMSSSGGQGQRGSRPLAPAAGQALTRTGPQRSTCDGDQHSMPSISQKASMISSRTHLCPSRIVANMSQPAEAGAHTKGSTALTGGNVAPSASNDVLGKLQDAGCSIKTLKEQLPESIRFGQIRLCLVHMGRLSSQ